MKNHDEQYLQYIQGMFGNASVAFFGIIIAITTLILICIIIMLNATTVFMTPIINNKDQGIKLPTNKPIVV